MKKRPSVSKLKKKLDNVYSEYIRRRDEDQGCFTCGKKIPWKEGHAGHFVSRTHTSLRWSEENVHLQCVSCNIFKGGNMILYYRAMELRYGRSRVDDLLTLRLKPFKLSVVWLEEEIEKYQQKIATL